MEEIVRQGMDIVAIPSERLNMLLMEYTRQSKKPIEGSINITFRLRWGVRHAVDGAV